jgi:hypothetical protein
MVFRGKARQQPAGMIRCAHHFVKVDHAVECATGPDPLVSRLPDCFFGFRVVAGYSDAFKRSHRGANQLDAVSVSARNQPAVGIDQVFGARGICLSRCG